MKTKFKPKTLREQVVVITGGSSGIGLATARLAGSRGASVVITSNNKVELKDLTEPFRFRGLTAPANML